MLLHSVLFVEFILIKWTDFWFITSLIKQKNWEINLNLKSGSEKTNGCDVFSANQMAGKKFMKSSRDNLSAPQVIVPESRSFMI